jgi:hypothetical protein
MRQDLPISTSRRPRERFHGRVAGAAHACAEPGCTAPGEFRAPVSNRARAGWKYFCLDHVRAFNAAYSYMDGAAVDARTEEPAPGWQRWTRAFASNAAADGIEDRIGVFAARMGKAGFAAPTSRGGVVLSAKDVAALGALGLGENASWAEIAKAYKARVRALHPDAHGGDRVHEAELRRVIDAYTHLKQHPAFSPRRSNNRINP